MKVWTNKMYTFKIPDFCKKNRLDFWRQDIDAQRSISQISIMEKLFVLTVLVLTLFSSALTAQCNSKKALSNPAFFHQDPSAKAAMIAAADDTIEERFDQKTGAIYYVRQYTSPWSGQKGYHLLIFDPQSEQFVEREDYAAHGDQEEDKGGRTSSCQEQGDSTNLQQRKLLPDQTAPSNKQPRRSSRVKLAAYF